MIATSPAAHDTALDNERLALASLALSPYPANAVSGWHAELFTSDEHKAIFDQLTQAEHPVHIENFPSAVDGSELIAIRRQLVEAYGIHQFALLVKNGAVKIRNNTVTMDDIATFSTALGMIQTATENELAVATMGDIASSYWTNIQAWSNAAPTGLRLLDDKLGGGFLPGRLTALLGAPGQGKTALAVQIAETMATTGRPVFYLTSEDSSHMILCRTLARLYTSDYTALKRGTMNSETIATILGNYAKRASTQRMMVMEHHGSKFSLDVLKLKARAHFNRYPTEKGVLVIDYLQRLARAGNAGQELRHAVTAITEQLRVVAQELDCSVLMLAAQGRDNYKNGAASDKSALGSAKESGDIEYTCDVLMAITDTDEKQVRPGENCKQLRIDKNRQGDTGSIALRWEGQYQRFSEAQ